MSNPIEQNRERVSALMDGQLRSQEFAHAVLAACDDADAQETWDTYHLIGDVLRAGAAAHVHTAPDFAARVQARLQAEGVAKVPVAEVTSQGPASGVVQPLSSRQQAANTDSFRWKMVAGFASLAAVAAIGWNSASTVWAPTAAPQLAQAPQSVASPLVAVAVPSMGQGGGAVMLRDPQLDDILAAHKQQGGSSALQMPAGFLRNATFEGHTR